MGRIIALSAWKQSGKDTMADILIKNYGYRRVAFADTLKDMVAEQYDIPRKSCDDPAVKEKPLLRYPVDPKDSFSVMIAQCLVREFRGADGQKPNELVKTSSGYLGATRTSDGHLNENDLYPVYWTPRALCILEGSVKRSANSQYWTQRALSKLDPNGKYVITDMRYRSEVAQIARYGEKFSHGVTTVRINRFENIDSTDSSEHDLDEFRFDQVLENKGTIEEFRKQIDDLMWRISE